ncbi:MAG: site-specific DNA-methyltransferase [Candidatus Nitrosocaldaceae archaeon]
MKRKEIKKFIDEDLRNIVQGAFNEYSEINKKILEDEIKRLRDEIKRDFGAGTIDDRGNVIKNMDAPKIKKYMDKVEILKSIKISEVVDEVYNHLYEFFSRYYEEGDFISKRRYGGRYKYHLPYNGEEVLLYWSNKDQYYVKSSEYFKNYRFTTGSYTINFLIRDIEDEINGVKGEDKYFILCDKDFINIKGEEKIIDIYFDYRSLTEEEKKRFDKKKRMDIQEQLVNKAIERLTSTTNIINKEILESHIKKYVVKNTTDYFIHKNLKAFLKRELEFYIKNEVLHLDELMDMNEKNFNLAINKANIIHKIGQKIIELLAQIEDFQKMLWEKKKFIINTEYVITLDRIKKYAGEEFLESIIGEILMNEEQLKEWKNLLDIQVKSKQDLIRNHQLDGKEWKKLPLDTRYFSNDFKLRLLEALSKENDLDEILDGILIKSDNWQALNLLLSKFKERIQCIYIDPPFNTGHNEFLYKNNYLDSTWISMMYDRLLLGKMLLNRGGSIYVRIDYHGNHYIRMLMDSIFGKQNYKNEIIVNRTKKAFEGANAFIVANDYLFFYSRPEGIFNIIKRKREEQKWIPAHSPGIRLSKVNEKYLKYYEPNQLVKDKNGEYYSRGRVFRGKVYMPPDGRHWTFSQERLEEYDKEGRIRVAKNGVLEYLTSLETVDSNWSDIPGYVVPSRWGFPTENSEQLLQRVIETSSKIGTFVLDYFLGSGTTTAVAHKLGRKWIGIEMGEHFWSIVLPRMKKVLYYDGSGISTDIKETYNEDMAGGFFKYHTLEQYEDSLENIIFDKVQKTLYEFEDYVIKYFLSWETKNSNTFLNIDEMEDPFNYKLNIIDNYQKKRVNVDVIETFNYLFGLHVEKVFARKDNGKQYIFVIGSKEGVKVAIVWRNRKDIDYKKDKIFVEEILTEIKPDRILINGDSIVAGAESIEPIFKRLMCDMHYEQY